MSHGPAADSGTTPAAQAPALVSSNTMTPPLPGTEGANPPPPSASATPQAGASPVAGPVFRANARLVQVDVVVTDKHGHPLHDLQQSNFTVLEDGKPQSVHVFESHLPHNDEGAGAARAAAPVTPVAQAAANSYSNIPAKEPTSSWTIVLLDLMNTAGSDQAYARAQLLQLLKSVPAGQPTALFVLTQRLEMLQGFTQDPAQLLKVTKLLSPSNSQLLTTITQHEREMEDIANNARMAAPQGSSGSGGSPAYSTDAIAYGQASRLSQWMNEHEAFRMDQRVSFTLAAMKGIARAVSGYPGRKNMLWLSGSFPINLEPDLAAPDEFRGTRGYWAEVRSAASLLATSRISVYPIDVRGLQGRGIDISVATAEGQPMGDVLPSNSTHVIAPSSSTLGSTINDQDVALTNERTTMKVIAEQTGGEAFVNTNDVKRAMQRSLDDGSSYYTLAYTPPKNEDSAPFHRIDVKVDQPGVKLSYRRGYYTVPANNAAENGTAALRNALQPGMPPATMLFLTATVQPPDAKRKEIRIQYVIDANGVTFNDVPGGKKHAQIDCMVIAFDKEGREVGHASDTLDATFPASAYSLILSHGLPAQQDLNLPPGLYNLRIGVMDHSTQQVGTVDVPLSIPSSAVAQR